MWDWYLASLIAFCVIVHLIVAQCLNLFNTSSQLFIFILHADATLIMEDHYEEDPLQYKTTGVAARVGDLIGLQQMVWNGMLLLSLYQYHCGF